MAARATMTGAEVLRFLDIVDCWSRDVFEDAVALGLLYDLAGRVEERLHIHGPYSTRGT